MIYKASPASYLKFVMVETPYKEEKPTFKESFETTYTQLLGPEGFEEYRDMCCRYPPKAVRVNTTKTSISAFKEGLNEEWELESVPWCEEGFWIQHKEQERHDVGNLYEHIVGHMYVQSAASMIPPVVLDVEEGMTVLDMCAAPGSKTTQIGQYMDNTGLVVANDSNSGRLASLGINVQRLGLHNVVVTNMDGRDIPGDTVYDRVLVDAPCSGTGTVMKSHKAMEMWSDSLIGRMKGIQQVLIRKGFELLRPGGVLVYSTCTMQPEENEEVVSDFLQEYGSASLSPIDLPITRSEPVTEWQGKTFSGVGDVLRIHPSDNYSEGFFVAKIKKES
jgi:NOL1/NOP2/sun family putative RNA methylase